jgi:hypothetical protein
MYVHFGVFGFYNLSFKIGLFFVAALTLVLYAGFRDILSLARTPEADF